MKPAKAVSYADAVTTAGNALSNGGVQTSINSVEWDIAGDCLNPRPRLIVGRKLLKHERYSSGRLNVDLLHRCRRCEPCLRQRRNLWAARAISEVKTWPRTWFVTLTIEPAVRYLFRLRHPDAETEFEAIHRAASGELTLYLKRVRKHHQVAMRQDGFAARFDPMNRIRYFMVAEAHKDGTPHYHMLVHQTGPYPLKKRTLLGDYNAKGEWLARWPHGQITQAKLVDRDPKSAWYVCKYLGKDARARVRASGGYGNHGLQP